MNQPPFTIRIRTEQEQDMDWMVQPNAINFHQALVCSIYLFFWMYLLYFEFPRNHDNCKIVFFIVICEEMRFLLVNLPCLYGINVQSVRNYHFSIFFVQCRRWLPKFFLRQVSQRLNVGITISTNQWVSLHASECRYPVLNQDFILLLDVTINFTQLC